MNRIYFFLLSFLLFSSCVEIPNKFSKIPPGKWRAVLKLDNAPLTLTKKVEEVEYKKEFDYKGELPFQFEVTYVNDEDFYVEIINGEERMKITDIVFGRDRSTAKDTVIFNFPVYDSYIQGIYEDGVIEGNWVVNYKDNYQIPFIAYHGKNFRFPNFGELAEVDLSGNWDVKFEAGTDDEYPAIGEFVQKGNKIRGTFLTETGDYRYLDGVVYENKALMSCFDGSHAFLFEAKQMADKSLVGTFRSGKHYSANWTAVATDDPSIASAFELTKVENQNIDLDFSFKSTEGNEVSIKDDKFIDKVKLVMIMGTWCPNCRDEMNFLKDYFKKKPSDQVELMAIGFERYKDEAKSFEALKKYKAKMDVDFEVLYGGYASKSLATEKFPMLDKIISWPTLLFVDKNNKIRKIHTGFNGPATSKFESFKKEFDQIVQGLINE